MNKKTTKPQKSNKFIVDDAIPSTSQQADERDAALAALAAENEQAIEEEEEEIETEASIQLFKEKLKKILNGKCEPWKGPSGIFLNLRGGNDKTKKFVGDEEVDACLIPRLREEKNQYDAAMEKTLNMYSREEDLKANRSKARNVAKTKVNTVSNFKRSGLTTKQSTLLNNARSTMSRYRRKMLVRNTSLTLVYLNDRIQEVYNNIDELDKIRNLHQQPIESQDPQTVTTQLPPSPPVTPPLAVDLNSLPSTSSGIRHQTPSGLGQQPFYPQSVFPAAPPSPPITPPLDVNGMLPKATNEGAESMICGEKIEEIECEIIYIDHTD